MRNYVIINGVNSLTINGLAINELPPISKPPMRVLQEEIDGRDGDITTDLGYGAYDKIMTIGLYNGYDINEIIAFFNKEGTIVFSDEADKYYIFKIIEQIDYERLIKFRTASITFHVQPFKYPLTNTPITLTTGANTITNQGNIYSKPILTISGSGNIDISLNNNQIFSIDMTNISVITIDSNKMEAYNPSTGALLNRYVTGNYRNLYLEKGNNTLTITGTISTGNITDYTRYL